MPSASRSSLSHSMTVRSGHRGVLDRHQLGQRAAGDHEAADVLRQMPRKAEELRGEIAAARRRVRSAGSSPASRTRSSAIGVVAPAPDDAWRARRRRRAKPKRLADLADRRARAVADHGRRPCRPGRGRISRRCTGSPPRGARARNRRRCRAARCARALMKRSNSRSMRAGSTDGDAEAIADGRVGRRAAALAEDVARPREAHDVVDGEEIGRVVELARSAAARARSACGPCPGCPLVVIPAAAGGYVLQSARRRSSA